MSKKLLIYGRGNGSIRLLGIIERINRSLNHNDTKIEVVGFLDDNKDYWGKFFADYPIFGNARIAHLHGNTWVCSFTDPYAKALLDDSVGIAEERIIDPSAILEDGTRMIGGGTIVGPNVIIVSTVRVGKHCNINMGATIGAQCRDWELLLHFPGARITGGVKLNDCCQVGSNAVVVPNIRVACGTIIGAGAVVTKDITEPGTTVVGVPAKPVEYKI
jgi:acetyltransferase-like isoleucine patch superfamily enzyme